MMDPAHLPAIRQSLEKAFRLARPRQQALQAFLGSLATLLVEARQQPDRQQAKTFLLTLLPANRPAAEEELVPPSSPVCYAQVPGLREGFEAPAWPAPRTGLQQAVPAACKALSLLLGIASPDKQVASLVGQLYELSPGEMAAFQLP